MKSRKLSFVLIFLFLVAYIFGSGTEKVNASVITFGDYEFDESTKTITKYNGKASNLVIPEKINNIEVKNIGEYSFRYCDSIKDLTIPGSVSSIGEYAFSKCYGIKKIDIYNGVKTIGANAFESCANLEEVTIPSSVESIGDYAFQYCHYFKTLNMGEGIKTIGNYAFNECSIDDVNIPNSVQSIGEYGFLNAGSKKIWISKNTKITPDAFGYWDEPDTIYITGNPTQNELESMKASFKSYNSFDNIKFVGILCKEDINNDKSIKIDDLANVADNYNVKKGDDKYKSEMDINGDGIIDIYDLVKVASKM